jgi:hypothetical protein
VVVWAITWVLVSAGIAGGGRAAERIDARRAAAAGLRLVEGPRLRLFTDLPPAAQIDELPRVFAAAVPQWADYFQVPPSRWADWRVDAFLIRDHQKLAALQWLPPQNRDFRNGFATADTLWLREQPSAYYRRHLLLHEGTHAFMLAHLGGTGPGWYMEATAELFGTHRWEHDQLQLATIPADRAEVPMWGRTRLVREAVRENRLRPLQAVLQIDSRRALDTTEYAWAWALAAYLHHTPGYRDSFATLSRFVQDRDFNDRFRETFRRAWPDLVAEWPVYVSELDYGYDFPRMAMIHRESPPLSDPSSACEIRADRGWQSTGIVLRQGENYRVVAAGSYQVAADPKPWISEPQGVTIRYHRGHPLGALLGRLRSLPPAEPRVEPGAETTSGSPPGLFEPAFRIGSEVSLVPRREGVLYVRVNDAPAELHDNRGTLEVNITPVSSESARN